jgi:hypothetical protein
MIYNFNNHSNEQAGINQKEINWKFKIKQAEINFSAREEF